MDNLRRIRGGSLPLARKLASPCRRLQITPADCPSNTENRRAVSRILAGTKQHTPGRSNILPGSAPALRGVILYPFSPLPLPLTHPITLTPNMERTRVRQHLLHIPAQILPFSAHFAAKWARTPEQDFRLGNLVPEVVTGLWYRLGWVAQLILNTSTSEAGGCHYAGKALCSSRTRQTCNTILSVA